MPAINKTAPDTDQYMPLTEPAIGTAFTDTVSSSLSPGAVTIHIASRGFRMRIRKTRSSQSFFNPLRSVVSLSRTVFGW